MVGFCIFGMFYIGVGKFVIIKSFWVCAHKNKVIVFCIKDIINRAFINHTDKSGTPD